MALLQSVVLRIDSPSDDDADHDSPLLTRDFRVEVDRGRE